MKERVLVAMSGGVDSSVTACLLRQQGHDVIGATLNLWSYEGRQEPYNECCSIEVRTVAHQIGIEHHFVDEGSSFKAHVVDPFVEESLAGQTPLPCARCNRFVRIPKLLELADRLGCAYVATGHHVRVRRQNGTYRLLRGRDARKDQSYFLYMLGQQELKRLIFPIGERTKDEVWELARQNGLVSARKPESQDLCFLPQGDPKRFLKQRANGALKPGEIVDLDGRLLGEHRGLAWHTIGQRRGLGLSAGEKLYVVAIDHARNRLVVGPEEALYAHGLATHDTQFVRPDWQEDGRRAEVKIRYRSPRSPATLHPEDTGADSRLRVRFDEPQRAITPGQAATFYRGEELLGGGTIARASTGVSLPD